MNRNYKKPVSKAININPSALLAESDPELKSAFSDTEEYNLTNERRDWEDLDDMLSF